MMFRLEMVTVPVSDVDRGKAFYQEQLGCTVEQDVHVDATHRFVEPVPPGSACTIALTSGYVDSQPGSLKGMQFNVDDADEAYAFLRSRGVRVTEVQGIPLGPVLLLLGPRRQRVVGPPSSAVRERVADLTRPGTRARQLPRRSPEGAPPATSGRLLPSVVMNRYEREGLGSAGHVSLAHDAEVWGIELEGEDVLLEAGPFEAPHDMVKPPVGHGRGEVALHDPCLVLGVAAVELLAVGVRGLGVRGHDRPGDGSVDSRLPGSFPA